LAGILVDFDLLSIRSLLQSDLVILNAPLYATQYSKAKYPIRNRTPGRRSNVLRALNSTPKKVKQSVLIVSLEWELRRPR
jgi:hypothetical protein